MLVAATSRRNTLVAVSADLHPSPLPSPSPLSLVLRATTALSAAPRACTEPTAPRPAPARTTSPARTSTASASAKKVASDLRRSSCPRRNTSEIKLGYSAEVAAFHHCGRSLMLSSYCSLTNSDGLCHPDLCNPTVMCYQRYGAHFRNITETILTSRDKFFMHFSYEQPHFPPTRICNNCVKTLYLASTLSHVTASGFVVPINVIFVYLSK